MNNMKMFAAAQRMAVGHADALNKTGVHELKERPAIQDDRRGCRRFTRN